LALYAGDLTKAHTHLKALAESAAKTRFGILTRSGRYRWDAPNVSFIPPTQEIERYYGAADAFIFPSAYDSFGMVVLEAMASGLPVFCSDRAGVAELIEHGRTGFVLPLEEWVEATTAGLDNRELLCSTGAEAEYAARRYDWASVVEEVESVYLEVVAQKKNVPLKTQSEVNPHAHGRH
jgi:UDP-glucose:(heptosyl)LPS alpha-1,3-glucosyltransferase